MILLVLGIGSLVGFAQNTVNNKLKIGDTMPDLPIAQTYNYKGPEKALSQFRGKILILDFWATWCGPCIAAFPKMEALRKKYNGQIQILPVTSDPLTKVAPLLQAIKNDKGIDLFSVVADTAIRNLFNFRAIPHFVIINKEGVYIADAQEEEINDKNIDQLLLGQSSMFNNKSTVIKRFDPAPTFFNLFVPVTINGEKQKENIPVENLYSSSILTRKIDGLVLPYIWSEGHILILNTGISNIFNSLFGLVLTGGKPKSGHFYFFYDNRVIWDVNNSDLLKYSNDYIDDLIKDKDPNWRKTMDAHRFCYEMKITDTSDRVKLAKQAINDLNNKFKSLLNLSAYAEKRKVKCLVLRRTSEADRIAANNGMQTSLDKIKPTFYGSQMSGQTFYKFMMKLTIDLQNLKTPIVDETGFAGDKLIDINLDAKMTNWKSVNAALVKYDLTFEEAERVIDMVIISDKKSPFFFSTQQ